MFFRSFNTFDAHTRMNDQTQTNKKQQHQNQTKKRNKQYIKTKFDLKHATTMPSRTKKRTGHSRNAKVLRDETNKRLALLDAAVERSVYDALPDFETTTTHGPVTVKTRKADLESALSNSSLKITVKDVRNFLMAMNRRNRAFYRKAKKTEAGNAALPEGYYMAKGIKGLSVGADGKVRYHVCWGESTTKEPVENVPDSMIEHWHAWIQLSDAMDEFACFQRDMYATSTPRNA